MKGRLEAFRDTRKVLRDELISRLHTLDRADAAVRLRALEAFAVQQTPQVKVLEAMAEDVRLRLLDNGLFKEGVPWDAEREWKLDRGPLEGKREEYEIFEYQVVRAAPFYHAGLSLSQRRHLREVTMEMEGKIFRGERPQSASSLAIFFLPETARVRFPDNLPSSVTTQLKIFSEEKAALKKELRDKIYAVDKERFVSGRTRALEEFAIQQASRFESLEELAEEIRRDLAGRPEFARVHPPGELSPEIVRRIAVMQAAGHERALKWYAYVKSGRKKDGEEPDSSWREPVEKECAAICAELAKNGLMPPLADGDDALSALTAELRARNVEEGLFLYFAAAFEPGMSPPQRRLLFGAAIEEFELPLPATERTPTELPGSITR